MKNPDRLYNLLPAVYRQRDAGQGYPLQALLQVVNEQVEVVEEDIDQLYGNWFIETCEEWVVPYLGDLIGYQLLNDAGEPAGVNSPRAQQREQILIPRRDVANTIHDRRRKGTLALLEELAMDAAGWPACPVEFFKLLGWTQNLHTPLLNRPRYHVVRVGDTLAAIADQHALTLAQLTWLNPALDPKATLIVGTRLLLGWRPARGRTADLRNIEALDLLDTPFDRMAHTIDVRRIDSHRTIGRYNIPSIGLFVWRLKSYSVGWLGGATTPSVSPAYCLEEQGPHCYTFSVLGNDTPLFNRPQPEPKPTDIASELNLPVPIRRRRFAEHPDEYYGANASVAIWAPDWPDKGGGMPIPASSVIIADLENWQYRAPNNKVVLDPERGRMVFPARQLPKCGVTTYYRYGFSADLGGGEYDRKLSQPADARMYFVGSDGDFPTINAALAKWAADKLAAAASSAAPSAAGSAVPTAKTSISAVIEITDSAVYTEKLTLQLDAYESLQIRAANERRPVIRLLDYMASQPDALVVSGGKSSRLTLDGLLVTGRGLQVRGPDNNPDTGALPAGSGDMCDITIRHCTLVPGWGLNCDCDPTRPAEPSIELFNSAAEIKIEHSIVGAIQVVANEAATDPVRLCLSDTFWDATATDLFVLSGPEDAAAYASLTVARCTVLGKICTHEITLAENCIFDATVCVARRQKGCVRFCYVPAGSRTPRRFECQPDLVIKAVMDRLARKAITPAEEVVELATEQARVEPVFNSTRYGTPTYGQLAESCATEITTGADDESEIGAFHDLYQPQRAANLRTRLNEYIPAGMDAGIIYAT
jgi:hypothetical protein